MTLSSLTGTAFGQDVLADRPYFAVLPNQSPVSRGGAAAATASLPTWNGSYVYNGTTYTYNMVGADPTTGTSTTVKTVIIPIKFVIQGGRRGGGGTTTFDPNTVLSNGNTVIQNTILSPMFDGTTTYIQGGVNVGTSQYIDAYQRANFWGAVSSHLGYHVLLGTPTVLATQTLSPSARNGKVGTAFGITVAEVNINYFDGQAQSLITSLGITPDTFPIFVTYDSYLTQGGCCIGGYHSATGAQSYTEFTYVDAPGVFSQDVSALSHEVGEWMDDPLVASPSGNQTPCGILENGDPLEGTANYGDYPYALHGFTYHLQDLVTLPYFGAPPATSVNSFSTFQGTPLTVCQNGA